MRTYLYKRDTVWRSVDLPAGASLAHAARGWTLLVLEPFSATILWHCLAAITPKGSKIQLRLLQLSRALTALTQKTRCTQSCTVLTKTSTPCAGLTVHSTADELLQSASITAEPLLII